MDKFIDRPSAGKILSAYLKQYRNDPDVIVLALPRGGVPVAYEIAQALVAPLDVFIVRKLGLPQHEELAMGAIASGGALVFNQDIIQQFHIAKSAIDDVIQAEQNELYRRELIYRGDRPFPVLTSKTVIIVDDGIATGASMKAAIQGIRQHRPAMIIVAVPVAAQETYEEIKKLADQIVCPHAPANFYAVGAWYEHFLQTSDEEVFNLLRKAISSTNK